jgi:hypothetical protein
MDDEYLETLSLPDETTFIENSFEHSVDVERERLSHLTRKNKNFKFFKEADKKLIEERHTEKKKGS